MHLWLVRRPLATCRAVLFSSLVDDQSSHPDIFPTEEAQATKKENEKWQGVIAIKEVVISEKEAIITEKDAQIAELKKRLGED